MAKLSKNQSRIRRAKRTRMHIRELNVPRLTVFRSPQHIYAQILVDEYTPEMKGGKGQSKVIVSASTIEKALRAGITGTKTERAKAIGKLIGERALAAGVKKVAFDRSGYKYHGRIQALADAAREAGIQF
jgi:large subunit ribosomal protein L18